MIPKESSSLELINARFVQARQKKEEIRKKKRVHRRILALLSLTFVCACVLWFFMPVWMESHSPTGAAGSAKRASVTDRYKGILTPQEIDDWNGTSVQPGKIYLKLKTEIKITGGTKAYIRLINPPYCMYDSKFAIAEKDTGTVLYQSETMEPGTVSEYINLNRNAAYGETPVCVTLQFCRHGKDRVIGTRKVDAVLVTSK